MEAKGPSLFLSFPPIHEHSNNYLQSYIWYRYPLFEDAYVIAQHLLNNTYQALEASIRMNVNFMLLVDTIADLITAIFHREVLYLNR